LKSSDEKFISEETKYMQLKTKVANLLELFMTEKDETKRQKALNKFVKSP